MKLHPILVLLAAAGTLACVFFPLSSAHLAADAPPVIGSPPVGRTSMEIIAKMIQDGPSVTAFGYLTHLDGLEDGSLFSNPAIRTEATARLTFFVQTTMNSHHQADNILTSAAGGQLTLYFNAAAGANFNSPGSFAAGQAIATFLTRFHTVNDVQVPFSPQSPGRGIVTVTGDLTQETAQNFNVDGQQIRLGHVGQRLRLEALAQGTLTQPDPPQAFLFFGGDLTVVTP